MQHRYVDALIAELRMRSDYLHAPVRTIYIGGGTPSVLDASELLRLIRALEEFAGDGVEEFTVECNPDDIASPDSPVLQVLAQTSVNRVSMGAQTFSDERLAFLHRRHKAGDVARAVNNLRQIGITNVSIDLMFGFPDQTLAEWESDVDEALRLHPNHLSAYSLMYEEGTALYRLLEQHKVQEIDEELSRSMYERLIEKLTVAGYEHYEISNFALPGMRSRHNSSYWCAVPYLGLGAAAHSYNGTSRQWNVDDVKTYCDLLAPLQDAFSLSQVSSSILQDASSDIMARLCEVEQLDTATRYNDLIATALRTSDGISLDDFSERYNLPTMYLDYLRETATPMITKGLLAITDDSLHLTRKALFVSDDVMSELICCE